MNKKELMSEMAFRTGSSTREALAHLEAFEEIVAETLEGGGEVHISDFGRFYVREREGREVPVFHAGKALRESIK